mmetsp:Transcript_24441/g.28106  ORF Transcript_24441/g.28106 Transcript_24441/m.28106 type:complete len:118 (+) Transcript_24441:29-382(+)
MEETASAIQTEAALKATLARPKQSPSAADGNTAQRGFGSSTQPREEIKIGSADRQLDSDLANAFFGDSTFGSDSQITFFTNDNSLRLLDGGEVVVEGVDDEAVDPMMQYIVIGILIL